VAAIEIPDYNRGVAGLERCNASQNGMSNLRGRGHNPLEGIARRFVARLMLAQAHARRSTDSRQLHSAGFWFVCAMRVIHALHAHRPGEPIRGSGGNLPATIWRKLTERT